MKIRVHSKRPRFRRAGIVFGREPITLDTAELGEERLAQIEAESMLIVERLDDMNTTTTAAAEEGKSATRPGKGAGAGGKEGQ